MHSKPKWRETSTTSSSSRASTAPDWQWLLKLIGDLVEPGLGAGLVLVAARGAGDADRADHLLPDLDRQGALRRYGIGHMHCEIRRVSLKSVSDLAAGHREVPRRTGL